MFFTREDILKIQSELARLGVKDSQFKDAHTPLDNNDLMVLSQGGRNVKIRIQDFLEQLHLLSSDDFINITTKFDAPHLTLEEAIQILPSKVRKVGLTITFQNISGDWEIWQFTGKSIYQFNEVSAWDNCKVSVNSIAVPDEEDLTMETIGTRTVSKFKDKQYEPESFSGMGRVYLRKNVTKVQDPDTKQTKTVNLLTQKMLGKENTVYIIQYDYDLNGQTITVPSGCVLDFQGGSFNNGTIKGTTTKVKCSDNYELFKVGITIQGSWEISDIYDTWFEYTPNSAANELITNMFNLTDDSFFSNVHFDRIIEYKLELRATGRVDLGTVVRPNYFKLYGETYDDHKIITNISSNTNIIVNSTIKLNPTNRGYYVMFFIHEKDNVTIQGNGIISGDAHEHIYDTMFNQINTPSNPYYGEFGYIFLIESCTNLVFRDITTTDAFGDNIIFHPALYNIESAGSANELNIGKPNENVVIDNVKIKYARRNGIAVGNTKNCSITNCYFEGCGIDEIKGTAPKSAIDFENDFRNSTPNAVNDNVIMDSCKFYNNEFDVSSTVTAPENFGHYSTVVQNCTFTAPIRINTTFWLKFSNCYIPYISNVKGTTNYFTASKYLCYERCQFGELMPYLEWIANEEQNEFIDCISPESSDRIVKNRIYLGNGRVMKLSIPRRARGIVKLKAAMLASHECSAEAEYNLGRAYKSPFRTNVVFRNDYTPSMNILKFTPLFSDIVDNVENDTWDIYIAYGKDLDESEEKELSLCHLWYEAQGITEGLTTNSEGLIPIHGGNYFKITDIKLERIDNFDYSNEEVVFNKNNLFPTSTKPNLPTLQAKDGGKQIMLLDAHYPIFWDSSSFKFRRADGSVYTATKDGNSTSRPTGKDIYVGYQYFDATLNKPIWWTGSKWVDATGADV